MIFFESFLFFHNYIRVVKKDKRLVESGERGI